MIVVNCFPIVFLSQIVIKIMNKRKLKSAIINVSSFITSMEIGYAQIYNASKAFDDFFSRSLAIEYRGEVDILSLRPLFVPTNINNNIQDPTSINVDQCAEGALG